MTEPTKTETHLPEPVEVARFAPEKSETGDGLTGAGKVADGAMDDGASPEILRPLIAPAAVGVLLDAVRAAEDEGALAPKGGWSRHLRTLIPEEAELRALEALASMTLAGAPEAAMQLDRRLIGLAQRYRVPRSRVAERAAAVQPRPHAHAGGPIDIHAALALRVATGVALASGREEAAARRSELALEGLFARLSLIAALAPVAAQALLGDRNFGPLITLLKGFEDGPLGPNDGPVRWPQQHLIEPGLLNCLLQAGAAFPSGGGLPLQPGYHLQAMDQPWACPGARVVLTGERFGSQPGTVVFHASGGSMNVVAATVDPANWSDTKIEVDIPATATSGAVWLHLPGRPPPVSLCGHSFGWPMPGRSDVVYQGGASSVDYLRLQKGTAFPLVAGAPLTLEWLARPPGAWVVLWIADASGNRYVDQGGLGSTDTFSWTPPAGVETTYTATLWAYHCGTWSSLSRDLEVTVVHQIGVRAIEVTQVVQFLEAADWPGGGADNSIPMVRGKPAMARVYLETNQASALSRESHYVELYGYDQNGPLPGSPLTTSARQVLPATTALGDLAGLDDDLRDQIGASANFILPASWLALTPPYGQNWSTLRLEAEVTTFGGFDVDPARATGAAAVRVYECSPLRVVLVRVQVVGPAINLAAPSPAVARSTVETARHMFPSPHLEVVEDMEMLFPLGGAVFTDFWFDVFYQMLQRMAADRDDDGDVIYCAVLPDQTPLDGTAGVGDASSNARGCAVFRANKPADAAHEMGHACGRPHTWDDASFPAYRDGVMQADPPTDRNGLGQWGVAVERAYYDDGQAAPVFRPSTTTAAIGPTTDPKPAGDIMSYRHLLNHELWPSPYTYGRLMWAFDGIGVSAVGIPRALHINRGGEAKPSTAFVSGEIRPGSGTVDVVAYHTEAWPHASLRSRELDAEELLRVVAGDAPDPLLWLATLDDRGELLASAAIAVRRAASGTLAFHVAVNLPPGARRLSLRRGGREKWGAVRREPPEVERLSAEVDGDRVVVRWHAKGAKRCAVSLSFDGGRTWRRGMGWSDSSSWSVPLAELRRGGPVTFRVLANDGELATGSRDVDQVLPAMRGTIVPAFPLTDGVATLPAEERVRLTVLALESDGTSRSEAEHAQLRWTSDRQGALGEGRTIDVSFAAGRHAVTVTSANEDGAQLELRVVAEPKRR